MLVFLKHRLVMLSMPKCGSTALETAFGPHADIVISGMPQAKHTPVRKYQRYLRKYLESFTDQPLEVVCLFRQPVDWLGSWWRYRAREELAGDANSTQAISFDDFVALYLDNRPGPARVGRQAKFVSDKDGEIGVDQIWRYDNIEPFAAWMADRLQVEISLDQLNVSPVSGSMTLADGTVDRLLTDLSREFQIYQDLAQ